MFSSFATRDLGAGLRLYRFWLYSAFIKLQLDHKRTFLSLLWGPITVFFVATILSLIWSKILGVGLTTDYFFYILIGFSIWSLLISKLVNRGVASLSNRAGELSNVVRPITVLPLEDIGYSFLSYFTALPFILAATLWYFGISVDLIAIFVFGLVLIWTTALGLSMTLGVLAFFVRDVLQIIKAVMRLAFLTTPIIWKPERLGEYEHLVWLNPFYSYIDICRSPLMGHYPHQNSIVIAISLTCALLLLSFVTLRYFGDNIRRRVFK